MWSQKRGVYKTFFTQLETRESLYLAIHQENLHIVHITFESFKKLVWLDI